MKYDGLINIWLNIKDLSRFPQYTADFMAINHLRCKNGYCFLSRSKTINNVAIEYCIDLQHKQILHKNLHNFNINDIILCKLPLWNSYVPAKIINMNDKLTYGNEECWSFENNVIIDNHKIINTFGYGTFNLCFPSCPDSDIYLTWHNGNTILRQRSMLTYKNVLPEKKMENTILKIKKFKKNKSYYNFAPFYLNDSDSDDEEINKCVEDMITKIIETVKPKAILHSGLFDKKDNIKSELLRYNLAWLKIANNYNDEYISISKKSINISHNNIDHTFLSNVAVIYTNHLKNIIKIQCQNNCGMKTINKEKFNLVDKEKWLEPQNIKFFKKYFDYTYFFNNKTYLYTYTGKLCNQAKRYLFNINKIDIK
jgi:hypothetical protein